ITIFSFFQSDIFETLHYDNGKHLSRFAFMYLMAAAASCLLPMLPAAGWILPAAALALTLFSNTVTGLTAYAGLLSVCAYFASADIFTFLLYFLTGVIFAVLFEKLDNDYKTGTPLSVAVIIYVVEITAQVVFQSYGALTVDALIMPVMNVFVTFMLMLVVLRFYCAVVIDKEKGSYLRINDQEYELLAKYKEDDSQTYYNAIHTAYFAEKTARLLHMDVDVAKNGGYYHRIIVLECKKQEKSLEEICKEHKFPPETVRLLQEYNYQSQPMKMRETVAVYLADSVVSTIMYLIGKEEDARSDKDYGKIATAVIHRKIESKELNNSDISLADLGGIEKIYTGEKLYYDFLRRE
ncbi:MAG: hypothetical protein K2M91_10270, partial [Lachnospiraceae bacterium]|nr:hypothetical protein [Lachnospiraceae bacterium]